MKKSFLIPIIGGLLIAFLLSPGKADAGFLSGNDLLSRQNSTEVLDRMQALGYVMGVVDAYNEATICPPANVTAGQFNDMTKNYLSNNPAIRHLPAELLISVALESVWPCKKQDNKAKPRV
jgi:hypothetical protein